MGMSAMQIVTLFVFYCCFLGVSAIAWRRQNDKSLSVYDRDMPVYAVIVMSVLIGVMVIAP